MQRNTGGTNRNLLPIFGCRKRQRQAIFADSIDMPNCNDDSLFVDDDLLNGKGDNNGISYSSARSTHQQGGNSNMVRQKQSTLPDESTMNYRQYSSTFNSQNVPPAEKSTNYSLGQSNSNSNTSFSLNNSGFNSQSYGQSCGNKGNTTMTNKGFPYSMPNKQYSSKSIPNEKPFKFSSNINPTNKMNSSGNSFNISAPVRPMNRNNHGAAKSNVRLGPSLGTVPPPSKNVKVSSSIPAAYQQQMSGIGRNQPQKNSFPEKTNTNQFSGMDFGTSGNSRSVVGRQKTNFSSNQADAVVPQKRMEISPPNKTSTNSFVLKKKDKQPSAEKLITTTIKGLQMWSNFTSKSPTLFEICGNLCSTVSYHSSTPEKVFTMNDGSADIKCVFWEIDRRFPQMSRGATIRCVGKLNEGYFHCLCVRNVKPRETQLIKKLIEKSDKVLQSEIAQQS